MASNFRVCDICLQRYISKPSVVFCSECGEALCAECLDEHSLSKNHITIPMTENQTLPSQICSKHNIPFDKYCRDHDCPCCKFCLLKDHKDCKEITILCDFINNVKDSNALQEVKRMLEEAANNTQRILKDRQEDLLSIPEQTEKIKNEIEQAKKNINIFLDKLESDLQNHLQDLKQKESIRIHKLRKSLEKNEKQLKEYQTNLDSIKQDASDLETYFTMKEIEGGVVAINSRIDQHDVLQSNCISFTINSAIQKLSELDAFGKIDVGPCAYTILERTKEREAHAPVPSRTIDEIELQPMLRINTDSTSIRGCCLMPDGRTVFADYSGWRIYPGSILIAKPDGSKDYRFEIEVKLDAYIDAFDIAYIDNRTIAVSGGYAKKLCIFDLDNKRIQHTIIFDCPVDGITKHNNYLMVCCRNKPLTQIDISSNERNKMNINIESQYAYTATFEDSIYYSNKDKNTVTCCDLQGNRKWEFENKHVLRGPLGLSSDTAGNVFVAGKKTNNVVIISADGQKHRQILSEEDGIVKPCVVHYEKVTNQLLVANKQNKAFLFKVARNVG